EAMVKRDAAVLVKDTDALQHLADTALNIINDADRLKQLSANAAAMALPHAAQKIADEVIAMATQHAAQNLKHVTAGS
ncbi:MAG TPA: hypothetical protein PK134_09035, partial [Bacteroidia bacterium]|nr:hypothetical protein [Bacteroidia bacterium]